MSASPSGGAPREEGARQPPIAFVVADVALVGVCGWFLASDYAASQSGEVAFEARTWAFMLNLTCTFVLVHRGIALAQRGGHDAPVRRGLGVLKWLAALGLPLLVATHIEREVQQAHRARIDALAADVAARTKRAVHERGHVTGADLASVESPYLSSLTVRVDTGEFLLQVRLPGLDADGYTGVWTSTEGRWHVHPTDDPAERLPPFDTSGPVLACIPSDTGLSCQ